MAGCDSADKLPLPKQWPALARLKPGTGPRYEPPDRMSILELRAQRGWTQQETARRFCLHPKTISAWMQRLDKEGERALVRIPKPVNKCPAFVSYLVRKLKVCSPAWGRERIADVLARAGLHLSASSLRRRLKQESPGHPTDEADATVSEAPEEERPRRQVAAKYPGHVVNVDLTTVPTVMGLFTMLPPNALPQVWPFVWWAAFAVDHFSRRVMGFALFLKQPSSEQVRRFLGRTFGLAGKVPNYTITDKGGQFWCEGFKAWCRRRKIKPRFGAVGRYGSIAVIERFIRSLKDACVRRITVPIRLAKAREEFGLYVRWS